MTTKRTLVDVLANVAARKLLKSLPIDLRKADRLKIEQATADELKQAMARLLSMVPGTRTGQQPEPLPHLAEWTRVQAACRVLGINLPKIGSPVDLELAGFLRRRALRRYHPDVSPGHDMEFSAANNAFEVLKKYNDGLGSK